MIGAFIFVISFFLGSLATFAIPSLPPGPWILETAGIPYVEYEIGGFPAWLVMCSLVNGVVYGFTFWLVFSIANLAWRIATKKEEK